MRDNCARSLASPADHQERLEKLTGGEVPLHLYHTTNGTGCQGTPYQKNNELLALADHALAQANQHKALWLASGDPQAWRLWRACLADREALLARMGDE